MNLHGIQIDPPSKYISFDQIDLIALDISKAFRNSRNLKGRVLNIDLLLDWLELSLLSDDFEEPEGVSFYAALDPKSWDIVQVNSRHEEFFGERPDVYRHCIGHEIGHAVLRHLEHEEVRSDLPLFGDFDGARLLLHKSSWNQYGLSGAEVKERQSKIDSLRKTWVKQALVNPQAREALNQLDEKFEPNWMFKQAEQFSRCISVPSDLLLELLEEIPLMSGWSSIYKLAKEFEVSATTMKLRLLLLKLIEIDQGGQPIPKNLPSQESFF